MNGEPMLASKWDAAFDLMRFLYVGFFSDLPAWVRYTVLGLLGVAAVHGLLSWSRGRSRDGASSAPEDG
ncbi:hypothetical protein [Streptomyces sp. bgisy082]|uniref:hypothetical protein n=1 Tax=Streptomyces sp. bgisy082 TaxID=3413776 RepID=UPI003D76105A